MDAAIQRHVLQYLAYHGFTNTADSFEAELRKKRAAAKAGVASKPGLQPRARVKASAGRGGAACGAPR